MNPQQIKRRSIAKDAHQVREPMRASVLPSAADPYQGLPCYDSNYQFSRNNPSYLKRSKKPGTRQAIKAQPAKLMELLFAIAFVLFSISFVSALSGINILGNHFSIIPTASGSAPVTTTESTPMDEWKRGSMPYLYQTDAAWADTPYAGATIKTHGCGPTALSMVSVYLKGKNAKNPASMAHYSEQNGYVDSGSTSWLFMSAGAKDLGLSSRELSADPSAIKTQLKMGHPIICSVGPGDFTTEGHFIVLSGVDANGKIEVRDPNSKERSHQLWDVDKILSQCRNLWVFS